MDEVLYTAALEGTLVLSKHGKWMHEGTPITHAKTADFFHRAIVWDDKEKKYFLKIGKGRASFTVEDTAYFVTELIDDTVPWRVKLADQSEQELDPKTLTIGANDVLYCKVKGERRARFLRTAYQAIAAHASGPDSFLIGGNQIIVSKE